MVRVDAIQDSEWFALNGPDRQVPASGTLEPAGIGYPPPLVGELATWFVPIKFHVPAEAFAAGVIAAGANTASAATAAAMDLLTFSPPSFGRTNSGPLLSYHGSVPLRLGLRW